MLQSFNSIISIFQSIFWFIDFFPAGYNWKMCVCHHVIENTSSANLEVEDYVWVGVSTATATLPSWRKDWKHKSGIYPVSSCVDVYLNPFIKSDTSDQVCLINIKFLYSESWLNHLNFNIKHLSPSVWGLRKY